MVKQLKQTVMIDNGTFSSPQIDVNLNVILKLDGKEYELEQFRTSFEQQIDHKGEPQTDTRGGRITITLSEGLPESVYEWAIKPSRFKDGEINFKSETGSSSLKIQFFKASCIHLERDVNYTDGLKTILILSPERLMINDIEHDNFWVE